MQTNYILFIFSYNSFARFMLLNVCVIITEIQAPASLNASTVRKSKRRLFYNILTVFRRFLCVCSRIQTMRTKDTHIFFFSAHMLFLSRITQNSQYIYRFYIGTIAFFFSLHSLRGVFQAKHKRAKGEVYSIEFYKFFMSYSIFKPNIDFENYEHSTPKCT